MMKSDNTNDNDNENDNYINAKREAIYIAPLQPLTLASVKTWGNSEGAGRVGLP